MNVKVSDDLTTKCQGLFCVLFRSRLADAAALHGAWVSRTISTTYLLEVSLHRAVGFFLFFEDYS